MPAVEGAALQIRAAVVLGIVGALGLVACSGGAGASGGISGAATVESPTYLPADLPGGFGLNLVRFDRRPGGYALRVRAHETTYSVDVTNLKRGKVALRPGQLAPLSERTVLLDGGMLHWRDAVASVTIMAVGPAGHWSSGLRTIGKRMVVVPQAVLDHVVAIWPAHPKP